MRKKTTKNKLEKKEAKKYQQSRKKVEKKL